MTVVFDHSCLVTTLKNVSEQRRFFGFIPPHGKELESDEEINVIGHILEAIQRGDRFGNRNTNAFLDALDANLIEIISTPAPILFDETLGVSKILQIDNGAVTLEDPCWETSLSEI